MTHYRLSPSPFHLGQVSELISNNNEANVRGEALQGRQHDGVHDQFAANLVSQLCLLVAHFVPS